jgi:hypothetical protein
MRRPGTVIFLAALLVAALISGATADTVKIDNIVFTVDGGVTPKKLPRKGEAPITLKVFGTIEAADGGHPAALKTLLLEFDKHGRLNTTGLPTCTVGKLQSTLTPQARRACGDALIGTGRVTADIALPEQAPFGASGPLLIFNGKPKGGHQVLIFHVHAHVPAPTTFVTTATISRGKGKYGTAAMIQIPNIVSGQGSLTGFQATLHKTWTYKGRKQSLLYAGCPTGSLYARGEFAFADGTRGSGSIVRPCTPSG